MLRTEVGLFQKLGEKSVVRVRQKSLLSGTIVDVGEKTETLHYHHDPHEFFTYEEDGKVFYIMREHVETLPDLRRHPRWGWRTAH